MVEMKWLAVDVAGERLWKEHCALQVATLAAAQANEPNFGLRKAGDAPKKVSSPLPSLSAFVKCGLVTMQLWPGGPALNHMGDCSYINAGKAIQGSFSEYDLYLRYNP
eukprot:6544326-Pyramimonas_sp.AAC.1